MANTKTSQTLIDGDKLAVIKVYIASDGAAGDLTDSVIVDVSALIGAPSKVTIEQIWTSFVGCSGVLEFDATTDVGALVIPGDVDMCQDYRNFGGIKDNSGAGSTGDITLSTTGFATAGDAGHIIIAVRKN
jgi:hypothetical protein